MTISFGLDIGSNSVGSAWINHETGEIKVGLSVFPAGVDESDEKRGDPKNAKRRQVRRTRITLARRSLRKRQLRMKLIEVGLLPRSEDEFKKLLEQTDPWILRREGLTRILTPFEFGRVLLHLSQRRGAVGFDAEVGDTGKVKAAMTKLQEHMIDAFGSGEAKSKNRELRGRIESLEKKKNRDEKEESDLERAHDELKLLSRSVLRDPTVTFGRFIADLRDARIKAIETEDRRKKKIGPREWRQAVRNKGSNFEFHADRTVIRDEFAKLWDAQKHLGGPVAAILSDELRLILDDESGNSVWRHKGLLFGQRKQSWDLGTLGRCVLHPSERCAPHADMYASRYLVVETVNNLKIIEHGKEARPLTPEERTKIKDFLSGPLGCHTSGKQKGQPKRSVSVTDLRELMGWGRVSKTSRLRFNIETDEEREINTDWFNREIVHGAVTIEKWQAMPEALREGINRAILKYDVADEKDTAKFRSGLTDWAGLTDAQADSLIAAWKKRPKPDAKRLNMSRHAVQNILSIMDRDEPWPDPRKPTEMRWFTQIEARKYIAANDKFVDIVDGKPLDEHTRRRYATGAKGATARDRHYLKKHLLKKNGDCVYDPKGNPLHEPPPAPMISNPVVRKAIHEVRRHVVEFLKEFGRKPDAIRVELSREAKMGKMDADRALFVNRLRNRIRKEIAEEFNLTALSSTQQRAGVDRVILCAQQRGVCPLCGNNLETTTLTARTAANGEGCELAHIIPRASGGHNGFGNLVLAHQKCNREMKRQTPRQYWESTSGLGFDKAMAWIEKTYSQIDRPKPSEIKSKSGNELWLCYFNKRDDIAKIEQFKKEIKDIQQMTERQGAATKYATRQVMSYLADAVFEGNGLPERGGDRRIFATDGLWTSRLRKEWGLSFDPHKAREKGLSNDQELARKEKDRGDHRHHAIDAIVIALTTDQVKNAWDERERKADREGINTADEHVMKNYRRLFPLPPPAPFQSIEELCAAVERAVYGEPESKRAVSHRPVKRKLIGALHEETLFGPVVGRDGKLTGNYTAKKSVLQLDPNHLRMPRKETEKEAIERLAEAKMRIPGFNEKAARKWARAVVASKGYTAMVVDPPPEKSGIVRDIGLRRRIRVCLSQFRYVKRDRNGEPIGEPKAINPDDFTELEMKQAFEAGAICHASGVPIRSVVLLRTMSEPVIVNRKRPDHATGRMVAEDDPASKRAYVGGNNHHIEIRAATKGNTETWSGEVVPAYEASQRKVAKLRAMKASGIPNQRALRKLPATERERFRDALRQIEKANPIVDRTDNDEKGGKFIMSLCEGEILYMRDKRNKDEIGYFVVAKLDKPQSIVVVPHWDARAATERKDSEGKKVPDSKREQFAVTPNDLKELAPPGQEHAVKVRVSPLGVVTFLTRD